LLASEKISFGRVSSIRRDREIEVAWDELHDLLAEIEYLVDVVVVEGSRDVDALRRLGYEGRIDVCSHHSISEADFCESLSREVDSVLILTDFDDEGLEINRQLTIHLERLGVKVEGNLRKNFARLMAAIGVYVIEALDNAAQRL
jgi:5S rRNA maturation endonuclease (ribonuclease M5)